MASTVGCKIAPLVFAPGGEPANPATWMMCRRKRFSNCFAVASHTAPEHVSPGMSSTSGPCPRTVTVIRSDTGSAKATQSGKARNAASKIFSFKVCMKNDLCLLRALLHFAPPPDPNHHLERHRSEAEQPKQIARACLREVEPVMLHKKSPGDGIVDMVSQRRTAAGKIVRGDHAAHGGVPAERHPAGSNPADGPATQCHRADGKTAESQQPDAQTAKRKQSDAQTARADPAHGNATTGI